MQCITIAGRIGRDAEIRSTQSGDSVCGFTVAVDVRNGREKATNWWRVSLWGKRGEALAQYLTKGASVTVVGEFSLGEYEGKPQLNIRASEIALQGGRPEGGQAQRVPDGSRGAPPPQDDLDDDSIPFARNDTVW
jgi:single-strand DNA-binding protein